MCQSWVRCNHLVQPADLVADAAGIKPIYFAHTVLCLTVVVVLFAVAEGAPAGGQSAAPHFKKAAPQMKVAGAKMKSATAGMKSAVADWRDAVAELREAVAGMKAAVAAKRIFGRRDGKLWKELTPAGRWWDMLGVKPARGAWQACSASISGGGGPVPVGTTRAPQKITPRQAAFPERGWSQSAAPKFDALRCDPKTVGRLAREKLRYVRPDETVIYFEPATNNPSGR